jgi:hypothetical protein
MEEELILVTLKMTLIIPSVHNKEELGRIEKLLIEVHSRLGIEYTKESIVDQESIKQSLVHIYVWEHIRIPQSQSGDLNLILLIDVNSKSLLYYPQYRKKRDEISIESFLKGLLNGEITSLASRKTNAVLKEELARYLRKGPIY